jgi:integrase
VLLNIKGVSIDSRPRADGRWQGRVTLNGVQKSVYGKTREEVLLKIQNIINSGGLANRNVKKEVRLYQWLDDWFRLYKKPKLKAITSADTEYYIERLKKIFADSPLKKISGITIQEKMLELKSARMRDVLFNTLNAALEKAAQLKYIKDNPCISVDFPHYERVKKPAMTRKEQAVFVERIKTTKHETLYLLLLTTGLRISEALALTKADITAEGISVNKNIVFRKQFKDGIVQNTPKTKAGVRVVPLPDEIRARLNAIDTTGRLFPLKSDATKAAAARLFKSIGMHGYGVHTLRHTYDTRLFEDGIPSKVRQYLMGHASSRTTDDIYTDVKKEHIAKFVGKIQDCFSPDLTLKNTDFDTKNPPETE